jgi:hypothetical protein
MTMSMKQNNVSAVRVETEALSSQKAREVSVDKEAVLHLLRVHGVLETAGVEGADVRVEEVILTLRKAKVKLPEGFFKDLAAMLQLPFLPLAHVKKLCKSDYACKFVSILPYRVIDEYLIIPLEITDSIAKVASANPLNQKAMLLLQCLLGKRRVKWYVASLDAVEMVKEKVYREIHLKRALNDLYYRNPEESAYTVLTTGQKVFAFALIQVFLIALIISFSVTLAFLFAVLNIAYFLINPLKMYIAARGFQGSRGIAHLSHEHLSKVRDEDLPVYTVLVPVYHEATVLSHIMRNIYRMDYPKDKLDVKILMEEKDEETLREAKALGLFGKPEKFVDGIPKERYLDFLKVFEPVIVPVADITTKPRACNYGLLRAKGKFCVIFDAEDNPDEDQLKKAAVAFANLPEDIVCLQSKLNFYNADENVLTGWFSIEYAYWFDYYLEGLDKVDAPIPLGGTSNHFRINQLRELGGWDPYNVTEDADLGIRLSRKKLRTAMMDSYTYEEATVKLRSWIRQRSRWYKGHVQTYLVHMRHPLKLLRELGLRKFLLFQFTFGGGIYMPLINPFLWAITVTGIFAPWVFNSLLPLPLQPICLFNLIVGNLSYILLYLWTCIKQRRYRYVPLALTMPVYWILISLGAWRGLIQLVTKPFYWEKTMHGVSSTLKAANAGHTEPSSIKPVAANANLQAPFH